MELSLTLIRHGLTLANLEKRYVGQATDYSLLPQGIQELENYKRLNRYPQVDALYVSPLQRCRETARILFPALTPIVIPALSELDFGSFEGKTYEQLEKDPAYRQWIDTAGASAPPGGESGSEFIARLEEALRQIAADATKNAYRSPAIVTHGGCIMAMLFSHSQTGAASLYDFQVGNGGGYTTLFHTENLLFSQITPL